MFPSLGISFLILLQIVSISSTKESTDATKAAPMPSSSTEPPPVDIPRSSAQEDTEDILFAEAPAIPSLTNEPSSVDIPSSLARKDAEMALVEVPAIPSSTNEPSLIDIPSSSAREDTDIIRAEAPAMPSSTNELSSIDVPSSSARKETDMALTLVKVPAIPSSSNQSPISDILPLVLIRFGADYSTYPTRFKRIRWLEKGEILAGDTRFSVSKGSEFEGLEYMRQIYMCDMGSFKKIYTRSKIIHDDRYCTYWTSFKRTEALRCRFEPVPFIEKVNTSRTPKKKQSELSCGPHKRGKIYRFVYKACLMKNAIKNENILENNFNTLESNAIDNRDSIEIYRFCYNEEDEEIVYTTHRIGSARLLFHDSLKQERKKTFQMMSDGYGYFGSHFQEMEKDYNELAKNEINPSYQVQKLTPHEDLEFALWRKPTYHYVNVKPMQRRQANLWNYISLLIREHIKENKKSYDVHTGVFTLPENRSKPPILGKINSPDIWLKYIEHTYIIPANGDKVAHDGIVIIMNTNYGNSHADTYFSKICEKNWCEKSIQEIFPEYEIEIKTVGCCPANREILKFFNTTVTIRNLLEIDSLTDKTENQGNEIDMNVSLVEEETEQPSKKAKLE